MNAQSAINFQKPAFPAGAEKEMLVASQSSVLVSNGAETNPTSFDEMNQRLQEAQLDWNKAAYTHGYGKKDDGVKFAKTQLRSYANAVTHEIERGLKMNLSELDWSSPLIRMDKSGILHIRDGNEERPMTLEEKLEIEEETQTCSVGLTEDQIEISRFFEGKLVEPPEALVKMAERENITIESRGDYEGLAIDKLGPSAMSPINGPVLSTQDLVDQLDDPAVNDHLSQELATPSVQPAFDPNIPSMP